MKLKQTPPKYGWEQEYDCGLRVWGSWASRIEEHEKFCKSKIGKYILELEEQLDKIKNEK
jgi:hypothetical protein